MRKGIDVYEMIDDKLKGFTYKTIGFLPSEKVQAFGWAGCGDIFHIFEQEGLSKMSLSFYMISKEAAPAS